MPKTTMQHIGKLRSLRSADFSNMRLTDADLRCLAGLQELRELKVAGELSDKGLEDLCKLPKLEQLVVSGSFTDKGLDHLSALTALRYLEIASDRLTANGLARLSKVLPRAKIHRVEKGTQRGDEAPRGDGTSSSPRDAAAFLGIATFSVESPSVSPPLPKE
jgi:hypothetical protein